MSKNEDYFRLPAATRRQHVVDQLGLQSSFPETSTHLDCLLSYYTGSCTMEPWHACYCRIVEPFDCRMTKYWRFIITAPTGFQIIYELIREHYLKTILRQSMWALQIVLLFMHSPDWHLYSVLLSQTAITVSLAIQLTLNTHLLSSIDPIPYGLVAHESSSES